MSDEHEIVQRLATVETDIRYIKADMQDQTKKIDDMHDILQNLKGMRYLLIAVGGLIAVGAALASIAAFFMGFLK